MRKHKIRKILHGLLDLLPLIVIPVFMIYSHRHTINDYSVDTTETIVTPLYETNELNSVNDLVEGNIYHADELLISATHGTNDFLIRFLTCQSVNWSTNFDNRYEDDISIEDYKCDVDNYLDVYANGYTLNLWFTNFNAYYCMGIDEDYDETFLNCDFVIINGIDNFKEYVTDMDIFVDNFTSSDFNVYDVQVNEGVILNDTDIGSQFIYSLYNTTTKYFNTDSVFNLKDLHSWIENNMFKGNMPLGVTIVYHIVVYEFIMDIIFLIYAVLMFVVDFATDFLEYCFSWSRRGGR